MGPPGALRLNPSRCGSPFFKPARLLLAPCPGTDGAAVAVAVAVAEAPGGAGLAAGGTSHRGRRRRRLPTVFSVQEKRVR